jgi:hypothetical protein
MHRATCCSHLVDSLRPAIGPRGYRVQCKVDRNYILSQGASIGNRYDTLNSAKEALEWLRSEYRRVMSLGYYIHDASGIL